jgi:mono/diheme cytochrome c family protein
MKLLIITGISLLSLLSFNSFAVDLKNGHSLHNDNCIACHTTDKYTSKTRKVQDLAALTSRVKRCDFSLGTQWFEEDIEDVVAYLNQEFYQFK